MLETGLTGIAGLSWGKYVVVDTISWKFNWVSITCNFYKSCMHSHVICICTRVAAAAEEVVYEVVAEPQEPQGKPCSRRIVGSRPKAHLTLALSRRLKASPGAHLII